MKDEKKWDDFAEISKNYLEYWDLLTSLRKCLSCKERFPEGIIRKDSGGKVLPISKMVRTDYLYHMFTVHGIPPEILLEGIQIQIREAKGKDLLSSLA